MHCYVSCSDCRFDRTVDVSALDRLWHHVCITWTKSGMYEVTKDGKLEGLGKRLVREQNQSIPGNIDLPYHHHNNNSYITPFAVHYRKIRIHLRLSTINNAKKRSFTSRCIHLQEYTFNNEFCIISSVQLHSATIISVYGHSLAITNFHLHDHPYHKHQSKSQVRE